MLVIVMVVIVVVAAIVVVVIVRIWTSGDCDGIRSGDCGGGDCANDRI